MWLENAETLAQGHVLIGTGQNRDPVQSLSDYRLLSEPLLTTASSRAWDSKIPRDPSWVERGQERASHSFQNGELVGSLDSGS